VFSPKLDFKSSDFSTRPVTNPKSNARTNVTFSLLPPPEHTQQFSERRSGRLRAQIDRTKDGLIAAWNNGIRRSWVCAHGLCPRSRRNSGPAACANLRIMASFLLQTWFTSSTSDISRMAFSSCAWSWMTPRVVTAPEKCAISCCRTITKASVCKACTTCWG
jgi:hypothetical protein